MLSMINVKLMLVCLLAGEVEKLERLLSRWHAKLKNWHTFGTLARLFARWHVKLRSWCTLGTLTRRTRWHA